MEQREPIERISGVLHKNINPTPFLVITILICLFIFPGLLIFLVPIIMMTYVKKLPTNVSGSPGTQPSKRKDWRRIPLMLIILGAGLLLLYAGSPGHFSETVLIFGICTGGFIWAPLGAYLVARFLLFVYDQVTKNTAHRDNTAAHLTAVPSGFTPAATPVQTSVAAPGIAPDLSALSPSEQSLVVYLADASSRGVTRNELTLILKGNGWLDSDISRGFELIPNLNNL